MEAEADFPGSTCDAAVTVTVPGTGIDAGAAYRPVPLIDPQALPMHPGPETLQLTDVLAEPPTRAPNCRVPLASTLAVAGHTETVADEVMVTLAGLDLLGSSTEVAVTVTVGEEGTMAGAV